MLEALSCVDQVLLLTYMKNDEDYDTLVSQTQPAVIAVTEGDPYLEQKKQQAQLVNAQVVEIPKVHTPSTSQLAKLIGLE